MTTPVPSDAGDHAEAAALVRDALAARFGPPPSREHLLHKMTSYCHAGVLDYVCPAADGSWDVGVTGGNVHLHDDGQAEAFLEGCRALAAWAHDQLPPLRGT